jgi:hypothetical protein
MYDAYAEMLAHVGMSAAEVEALLPEIEAVTKKRWNVTDKGTAAAKQEGAEGAGEALDGEVMEELRQFFAPHNECLYQLLGRRLWNDEYVRSSDM